MVAVGQIIYPATKELMQKVNLLLLKAYRYFRNLTCIFLLKVAAKIVVFP